MENKEQEIVIKANCGHYHSEKDTQVVLIKFVIGKDCKIEDYLNKEAPRNTVQNTPEEAAEVVVPVIPTPTRPVRKIIPPQFLSLMKPPLDAGPPGV